jgi:hypothetical protein
VHGHEPQHVLDHAIDGDVEHGPEQAFLAALAGDVAVDASRAKINTRSGAFRSCQGGGNW